MPIRREFRHFYTSKSWKETRARILARAKNCCEECGKPNGKQILTSTGHDCSGDPIMIWSTVYGADYWHDQNGKEVRSGNPLLRAPRRIIVVQIHVCHLNNLPGDDRPHNLKALCNWHHFILDRQHHHETRSLRKDLARPLLVEACG